MKTRKHWHGLRIGALTIGGLHYGEVRGHRDADFPGIFANSERQDSDKLTGTDTLVHRASLDFDVWAASA